MKKFEFCIQNFNILFYYARETINYISVKFFSLNNADLLGEVLNFLMFDEFVSEPGDLLAFLPSHSLRELRASCQFGEQNRLAHPSSEFSQKIKLKIKRRRQLRK